VKTCRQQAEMAATRERYILYGVPMELRRAIAKARVAAYKSLTFDQETVRM
jgi:hypothetical protein